MLIEARLNRAKLNKALATEAHLRGANFNGANQRGLFTCNVDLHSVQLENAIMPDGTRYGQEVMTTIR